MYLRDGVPTKCIKKVEGEMVNENLFNWWRPDKLTITSNVQYT